VKIILIYVKYIYVYKFMEKKSFALKREKGKRWEIKGMFMFYFV